MREAWLFSAEPGLIMLLSATAGRCANGSYSDCIPLIVLKPADAADGIHSSISVDCKGMRVIGPSSGANIRADGGYSSLVVTLVQTALSAPSIIVASVSGPQETV